jgi:hypothetical protein
MRRLRHYGEFEKIGFTNAERFWFDEGVWRRS